MEHIYEDQEELTHREWFIKRPHNYLGSVQRVSRDRYVYNNGMISKQEVEIVPSLIKIFAEIIDNSVDQFVKTSGKFGNKITINVNKEWIEVTDNGPGILNELNNNNEYPLYVAMCKFMSGSNYKDIESTTKGTNGVGIKSTITSSSTAIITNTDMSTTLRLTVTDNNLHHNIEQIKKQSSSGITLKIKPDFDKIFAGNEIDELHISMMKQYVIMQSLTYTNIVFKFNGQIISMDEKKFMSLIHTTFVIHKTDNYFFAITPNETDEFKQMSYINGLELIKGGTHVNYIMNNIVNGLREKLSKKYKSIKPADIKNKLQLIIVGREFINMKQEGQTKETLDNSESDVKKYLGDVEYDKLVNQIYKTPELIDPITEIYKIKEEFAKRKELQSLDKPKKKIKSDKYYPSIGVKKYLVITEGESAFGSVSTVLGRNEFGYYLLKGKPLNAWASSQSDFTNNVELKELYQIIQNEGYQYIVAATDQDLDGIHIRGLLTGFIQKYLTEFNTKFCIFDTPIVALKKQGKIVKWFYEIDDYNKFDCTGYESKYYKGLGSWLEKDLKYIIQQEGLHKMINLLEFDDTQIMNDWLSKTESDRRKQYIQDNCFSIALL